MTGGYYDAGDNVKYQFPMAFTITLLSWSVLEYETELLIADQLRFAHANIRWATDYFLKAVTGPTQIWVQAMSDPFFYLLRNHTNRVNKTRTIERKFLRLMQDFFKILGTHEAFFQGFWD